MALLFLDSFDAYTAASDTLLRWTSVTNTPTGISAGNGRNGTNSYRIAQAASLVKSLGSSYSTLLAGFGFRPNTSLGASQFFRFKNGSNIQIELRTTADGKIGVYRNATLLATSTNVALSANVYVHVQIKVVFSLSTSGSFHVKVNDVEVTWDIGSGNTAIITAVTVATADTVSLDSGGSSFDFDDFWVCDTSGSVNNDYLGDVRIQALFPNGAGNSTQWTPNGAASNYQATDESAPNSDTDYVSDSAAGDIDLYSFGDLASTAGSVKAVQTLIYARKDDAGTRTIAPVLRNNSTNSVGASVNLSSSYAYYSQIFETNPSNSNAAWTVSDVNGGESGVKLIA